MNIIDGGGSKQRDTAIMKSMGSARRRLMNAA
jgi:hypothetical protein